MSTIRQRKRQENKLKNIKEFGTMPDGSERAFTVIPKYSKYAVSRDGYVKKLSNGQISRGYKDGHGIYTYVLRNDNNKRQKFRTRKLIAMAFIPNSENKPTARYIDKDLVLDVVENIEWATYTEQNLCTGKKMRESRPEKIPIVKEKKIYLEDFKTIPGFTNYEISKSGLIRNKTTDVELAGFKTSQGYVRIRLLSDSLNSCAVGLHRLLGIVFIAIPDYLKKFSMGKLVIHHIDAVKDNNNIIDDPEKGLKCNLEWATYSENSNHSITLGTLRCAKPILIKDIDTGEIVEYPSIGKCAKAMGMSHHKIQYRLAIGEKRIFPERKQYRYASENVKWYTPDDVEKCMMQNRVHKRVIMKHIPSGDTREFDKVTDLAAHLKWAISTISVRLKTHPALLPGFVQIKWSWDKRPWVKVEDLYKMYNTTNKRKSIKRINIKTGEEKYYSYAIECARDNAILPTTLNNRLKSNGKTVFSDSCTYERCS